MWGTGIGWVDVKRGKWVKKKDKLANCLLTLWESSVIVEPSLPTTSYSTKYRSSDRSSGSGCPANNLTWPPQPTLLCRQLHEHTCMHMHTCTPSPRKLAQYNHFWDHAPGPLKTSCYFLVKGSYKQPRNPGRHVRLMRIRSYLSLYLLSVTSTWPRTMNAQEIATGLNGISSSQGFIRCPQWGSVGMEK